MGSRRLLLWSNPPAKAIRCPDCACRMSQTRQVVPQSFAGSYWRKVMGRIYRGHLPCSDLVPHRHLNFEPQLFRHQLHTVNTATLDTVFGLR